MSYTGQVLNVGDIFTIHPSLQTFRITGVVRDTIYFDPYSDSRIQAESVDNPPYLAEAMGQLNAPLGE